jgi:5-methylcytosine-specific restriction endonuclease McrA
MKRVSSRRAKACDIPRAVKINAFDRDNGVCILCGRPGMPNAHYIPRSQGGLGIEENIVTLCIECHHSFDNTPKRQNLRKVIQTYLKCKYPDWDESKLVYKKGAI